MKKIAFICLMAAGAAALTPPLAGYVVFSHLRADFDGRLQGRYEPIPFRSSFRVSGLSWEFPGKVKVHSGRVDVEYDPVSFFSGEGLRIRVRGEKIPVDVTASVLGQNFKKITLERVAADIKLRDGELREIYRLEVVSPELNLKMGHQ